MSGTFGLPSNRRQTIPQCVASGIRKIISACSYVAHLVQSGLSGRWTERTQGWELSASFAHPSNCFHWLWVLCGDPINGFSDGKHAMSSRGNMQNGVKPYFVQMHPTGASCRWLRGLMCQRLRVHDRFRAADKIEVSGQKLEND